MYCVVGLDLMEYGPKFMSALQDSGDASRRSVVLGRMIRSMQDSFTALEKVHLYSHYLHSTHLYLILHYSLLSFSHSFFTLLLISLCSSPPPLLICSLLSFSHYLSPSLPLFSPSIICSLLLSLVYEAVDSSGAGGVYWRRS